MTTRVQVVAVEHETDEEYVVGQYDQGVMLDVFGDAEKMAPMTLRDVASGRAICSHINNGFWFVQGDSRERVFGKIFIQTV